MPSHFSKGHFSICAFDSFDHADRSSLSGTHSDDDTAVVMFQVKPDIISSKPSVTAMNLPNSTEHFRKEPPCQRLRNYNKPKSSTNLPPNCSVDEDLYQNEEIQNDHHNKEFILSLIKTGLNEEQESIPSSSWAGCHALISSTNVPIMHAVFLPYFPQPIIEHSTIFTALFNFLKILLQLNQTAQNSMMTVCSTLFLRLF